MCTAPDIERSWLDCALSIRRGLVVYDRSAYIGYNLAQKNEVFHNLLERQRRRTTFGVC